MQFGQLTRQLLVLDVSKWLRTKPATELSSGAVDVAVQFGYLRPMHVQLKFLKCLFHEPSRAPGCDVIATLVLAVGEAVFEGLADLNKYTVPIWAPSDSYHGSHATAKASSYDTSQQLLGIS